MVKARHALAAGVAALAAAVLAGCEDGRGANEQSLGGCRSLERGQVEVELLAAPSAGGGARGGSFSGGSRGSGSGGRGASGSGGSKGPSPSARPNGVKPAPKVGSSRVASPKYRSYSPRYYPNNSWMWFYFAATAASDEDDPSDEEFDRWLDGQGDEDLKAAEQQYRDGDC